MRYLVLFPEAENIHLIKDVGMMPYMLHETCGYTAALACYQNGEYPYLQKEVKGLKLVFPARTFHNTFLDFLVFMIKNKNKFDAVQTFHFQLRSLLWLYCFKLFRPHGKTYLKLDAGISIMESANTGLKAKLRLWLLRKIDIVSVETTQLQKKLSEKWNRDVAYIPNGFFSVKETPVVYAQKENRIITVGRIGAKEKDTEVLLNAFAGFAKNNSDWKLELVGPVEVHFQLFIEAFFIQHPELKDRVIFTGPIYDRAVLFERYAKAKIFCLPSKWESFGIACLEAQDAGCYTIISDILSARDITANETFGKIFPVGDVAALSQLLNVTARNESLMKENCSAVQQHADTAFSWSKIVGRIDHLIKGTV